MGKKLMAFRTFLTNNKVYTRLVKLIFVLGMFGVLTLMDHACDFKNMTCDSKSKINIELKKGG